MIKDSYLVVRMNSLIESILHRSLINEVTTLVE